MQRLRWWAALMHGHFVTSNRRLLDLRQKQLSSSGLFRITRSHAVLQPRSRPSQSLNFSCRKSKLSLTYYSKIASEGPHYCHRYPAWPMPSKMIALSSALSQATHPLPNGLPPTETGRDSGRPSPSCIEKMTMSYQRSLT